MSAGLPDRARRRLIEAARSGDSELPFDDPPARPDRVEGGRYRIVRELGRGAMGIVYEAEDQELRRRVALKVLPPPSRLDPSLLERFVREARAVAKLSHPNIAAVYDATPNAIAMQLVNGRPLSDEPADDVMRILRLVRDAALAVHHAHERGIIHRDLKPQNLLVEGDRVLVTDFGLAKSTTFDSTLSFSGHLIGTPSYMAPEQAEGRVHDVDARTDVWGLGATLFAALAGRPPFEGRDLVEVLRKISQEDPPRLRTLAPNASRDVEAVVGMCLEKDRHARYDTALALADDLTRILEHRVIRARPPSLAHRTGRFVQRRPAASLLVLVTVVGLAALGVMAWNRHVERAAADDAMRLSHHVFSILDDAPLALRLGENEQLRERIDEGIDACRAFLATHGDSATVHYLLGKLLRARRKSPEAREALDRALAMDATLLQARLERGLLVAAELAIALAAESRPVTADDPGALAPPARAMRAQAIADLEIATGSPARLSRVDAAFARAELDRLTGDRLAARRGYEEIVNRLDPTHVEARLALSRLEVAEGDGAAAFKLAMSAMDLYRGFGPAYVARAAPFEARPPRPSAEAVDRATAQHAVAAAESRISGGDRSADAFLTRGSARLRLDDVEGAFADLSEAVKSDPSDALVRANRGLVRARRAARVAAAGNREAACAEWDAAIADDSESLLLAPELAGVVNNRGVAHLEKARLLGELGRAGEADAERARAAADFTDAVRLAPRFALARLNRGILHRREAERHVFWRSWQDASESIASGLADIAASLELLPDDVTALAERARLLELSLACERRSQDSSSRPQSAASRGTR